MLINKNLFFLIIGFSIASAAFYLLSFTNKKAIPDASGVPHKIYINSPMQFVMPAMPDTIWFLNERVPIEKSDVKESLERELIITVYRNAQTILNLKRSTRFLPVIDSILQIYNLPSDLKYIAVAESDLSNAISPSGATGFWQFMKPTALEYGLEINEEIDERYHFEKSTHAACKFLKRAFNKYNNWLLAIASYNCGAARLDEYITAQKVNNYYDLLSNNETGRYLFRIIAIKLVTEKPELFGYFLNANDYYQPVAIKKISIDTTINNLVDFAQQQKVSYKNLKMANPWLMKNKLTVAKNKKYELAIPIK